MNKEFFTRRGNRIGISGDEYEVKIKYSEWSKDSDICLAKYIKGGYFLWVVGKDDMILENKNTVIDILRKAKVEGKTTYGQKKGGAWQPYVRPRSEVMSIIAQSSYEAAVQASCKIAKDKLTSVSQVKDIAGIFATFISEASGLNSPECKTAVADALKSANQKSIVYQTALKRAIDLLDLTGVPITRTTQGLITLTEEIVVYLVSLLLYLYSSFHIPL